MAVLSIGWTGVGQVHPPTHVVILLVSQEGTPYEWEEDCGTHSSFIDDSIGQSMHKQGIPQTQSGSSSSTSFFALETTFRFLYCCTGTNEDSLIKPDSRMNRGNNAAPIC